MDGITASTEFRKRKRNFPIIGVTGDVSPSEKARFEAAGANLVLTKPLRLVELEHVLTKYLNT